MKKLSLFLIIAGLCLGFLFRGQDFNGTVLIFIGLVILLFSFIGKKLKKIIAVILSIGVVYFIIVEIPIVKASSGDTEQRADYLIVLGAAIYGETPSLSMTERCDAAIDCLKLYPDCIAIVSGGQGNDEIVSEAEVMKRLLLEGGIREERIIVEGKSFSTYENLKNSAEFIPDGARVAVCTSEYHIYRAKLIGNDLNLELIGVPAKTGHPSVRLNYFIREAFGVTYQKLLG